MNPISVSVVKFKLAYECDPKKFYLMKTVRNFYYIDIGGSRDTRPLSVQFLFMQFSANVLPIIGFCPKSEADTLPVWEILDPSLLDSPDN